MKITKKVCIYILIGLITITSTFTSFYKGAYAFEYVGGALAFEEAIKWLLASVGIISAGGMTADYWEQHGQEFEDYCTQQNITDTEVANWQLKLCEGILDKGSECWQAFKEWASTLTSGSSGDGGSDTVSCYLVIDALCDIIGNNNTISYDSAFNDFISNTNQYFYVYSSSNHRLYFLQEMPTSVSFSSGSSGSVSVAMNTNCLIRYIDIDVNTSSISGMPDGLGRYSGFAIGTYNGVALYHNNKSDEISFTSSVPVQDILSSFDSDFVSVQSDVTDLDIISSPIPDTDAQEVAIPMPGVADSDNEASAEAYDNIVDQVNDGTLELDDAITQVIDTLKIIVYEQETEKIFPKPENEEDQEDLDDKINQNKDNMGFTLGGLETVFPFCIPWDIYAFINLLRADPVPPKVELPFPNPLDPDNPWTVEVDFSDWDDGMKIVRLAEDFLFIIGLAVLTRSLIGAGGGDG